MPKTCSRALLISWEDLVSLAPAVFKVVQWQIDKKKEIELILIR